MNEASHQALLAANAEFYAAFEARDLPRMSAVWEHSDRVICTHPGWSPMHGWAKVEASWYVLFTNAERLQFVVTGEVAHVAGEAGWVSCSEDLLDEGVTGRVVAFNLFAHVLGEWRLVAHVASLAPV